VRVAGFWSSQAINLPSFPGWAEAPMARRTFYVIDIVEILVHWHAGRSQHELAASLNVDRKTISYAVRGIMECFSIMIQMPGDRRDRPATPA
jgi:hypothetical protein